MADDKITKAELRAAERLLAIQTERKELMADLEVAREKGLETEELHERTEERRLALKVEELNVQRNIGKITEEQYHTTLKRLKLEQADLKIQKQKRKEIEAIAESYKDTFEALTGVSNKWSKTALGQLMQPGGMEGFSKAFKETFTAENIIGSTMMKMQEATILYIKAQDDATVSINKTMGATGEYEKSIRDLERQMVFQGVTMDEARETHEALLTQMTEFTKLGSDEQAIIKTLTATMGEMGVSTSDTAGAFEVATKSFSMGVGAAELSQRQIATAAQALDVSVADMMNQAVSAGPKLSKFGRQGTEAFIQLAAASKATGIEIGNLLAITEKFDRFDGAADSVGKLNAVLGGQYLSTLDIMEATDPIDRIRMLQRAFQDAGVSVDNYWQMLAVADATGRSVDEVTKILNGDLEEQMRTAQADAKSMEELTAALAGFQTLGDEFIQTMRVFAVENETAITTLTGIAKGVLNLIQAFPRFFFWVGVIGAALVTWRLVKLATGIGGLIAKFGGFAVKAAEVAVSTKAVGAAARMTWKQTLALGGAFALMGIGVMMASAGLGTLAKNVGEMNDNQGTFIAVTAILIGGFIGLGVAGIKGGIGIGIAAAAMLAFGASIMMVSSGFGAMAEGLSKLGSAEALKPLTLLASTLGNISGFGGLGVVAGMVSMAGALVTLKSAVNGLNIDKIESLQGFTAAVQNLELGGAEELKIERVVKNVNDMTPEAAGRLQNLTVAMATPATTAVTAVPAAAPTINMSPKFTVLVQIPSLDAELEGKIIEVMDDHGLVTQWAD